MNIRILPNTLVNQIAAGEVIERPSSVVKELAENAIDAGSKNIEIRMEQGGKTYLSVTDDGSGIPHNELPLAIERHATSKLAGDDLVHIQHLGFRGEALPSIGSIARLSISSRPRNQETGWQISVEGGDVTPAKPCSMPHGTRVEVRDVFFATPARLKFLKTDRTETQHSEDIVLRLAMVHPDISFNLIADGKSLLSAHAAQGDLLDRRLRRLHEVLGKEFAENVLPLAAEHDGIALSGFCGLPTYHRGTSAMQYLFVNGRPVRDRLLLGVLRAAYRDFISHDRHPVAVVFLDIPADAVDVNVHPAKAEVRFRDAQTVRSLLIGAIKHALHAAGHRATTSTTAQAIQRIGSHHVTHAHVPSAQALMMQEPPSTPSFLPGSYAPPQSRPAEIPLETPGKTHYPLGAARAQLHQTYIIAETDDGMVLVDQHAAHERLVYERLKQAIAERGIERQKLLIPEVIFLGESAAHRLLAHSDALEQSGLVIEPFGEGTIVVREIPALMNNCDVQQLVRDLVDDVSEWDAPLSLSARLEHLCGTFACHHSVRAGRTLNPHEMNALLRQMETTPHSGQCNHGRPTYVTLRKSDIEALFGRSG